MSGEDVENGGEKGGRLTEAGGYSREWERRSNWVSWLIPLFVLVSVVVFVVELYLNNCRKRIMNRGYALGLGFDDDKCVARFLGRFSFQPLQENPLFGPSSSTLEKMGALNWRKVVHENQAWRLISCIWLHAGLIHLLVNMLSLIVIGIRLEQQFGFVRIGIIYLLSGIGGSILSSLFIRNRISVGASGALFGLLGSMFSELMSNWSIYTNKVAALLTLVVIVAINLVLGILPHVDNFAHIGGFLAGFLLGFVLLPRPQLGWSERHNIPAHARVKFKYKTSQYILGLFSLILLVAGFTVGLVLVFRGVNGYDRCRWCHYLNCVPTSKWKCEEE